MAGVAKYSSAVLLIVCGAINALLSKIVYQLEAPDCSGTVKPFEKPWLQTALMFMAMALCLPIAWTQQRWLARRKHHQRHQQQQQQHQHQQQQQSHRDNGGSSSSGKYRGGPSAQKQQQGGDGDLEAPVSPADATAAVTKAALISAALTHSATATSPRATAAANATLGVSTTAAAAGVGADGDLTQPLLAHSSSRQQQQQQQQQGRAGAGGNDSNSSSGSSGKRSAFREALLLCVPTGFDLAATTLMNVGLLYVAASVFQILRGAEMIFAALFAVTFLHRPLNRWHYSGVALCMAGIGCVGASRMLAGDSSSVDATLQHLIDSTLAHTTTFSGSSSLQGLWHAFSSSMGWGAGGGGGDPKKALLGMGLILLSQAIQAGQVTVEDHLMSDLDMQPLLVVGWEGLIGSLVMLGGALPLLQALPYQDGSGFAEDTVGSWCMIRNSRAIAGALGISTFAVLLYNIFGMYVTDSIGAAARVVLENARTLLVWLAALALYYTHVGGGKVGEPWDSWSWLQAVGFAIFAAGALLYNKGHKQQEVEETAAGKTPRYSKWAVLKSTLGISTGHRVAARRFRVAGAAVLAGVRAGRMASGRLESVVDDESDG